MKAALCTVTVLYGNSLLKSKMLSLVLIVNHIYRGMPVLGTFSKKFTITMCFSELVDLLFLLFVICDEEIS